MFGDMRLAYLLSESYRVVGKTVGVNAKRQSSVTSTSCMDLLSSIFCSFHNLIVGYLHLRMLLSFISSKAFHVTSVTQQYFRNSDISLLQLYIYRYIHTCLSNDHSLEIFSPPLCKYNIRASCWLKYLH